MNSNIEVEQMLVQWLLVIGTFCLAAVALFVALFQDKIRAWRTRPSFTISTAPASPFCQKILFRNRLRPDLQADGYFLRVSVKNTSTLFPAKSAEFFASKLLKKGMDGTFKTEETFEPINLIWSHSFRPFADISPEMERYCFIGRILNPKMRQDFPNFNNERLNPSETCLSLATEVERNTKTHIIGPGKYQLICLIGANNMRPIKKVFEIDISGEWLDDELKMFEKGFNIEVVKN